MIMQELFLESCSSPNFFQVGGWADVAWDISYLAGGFKHVLFSSLFWGNDPI